MALYREDVDNRSLRIISNKRNQRACVLWNRAIAHYPQWSRQEVTVPSYRRTISFARDSFPEPFRDDLDAYTALMTGDDLMAQNAPDRLRKPSTMVNQREKIRRFASALVRSGTPIEKITSLAVLVERQNFKLGFRYYLEWLGGKKPSLFEIASTPVVVATTYAGLVERVVMRPIDKGFEVELVGEIANMVKLPTDVGSSDRDPFRSSVNVVTGARYQPLATNLRRVWEPVQFRARRRKSTITPAAPPCVGPRYSGLAMTDLCKQILRAIRHALKPKRRGCVPDIFRPPRAPPPRVPIRRNWRSTTSKHGGPGAQPVYVPEASCRSRSPPCTALSGN